MAEKTEIEVLIDGKVYKVSGYESVEYIQKIANYINAKERDLKAQGIYNRIPNTLRAYLMDLNIADDYFKAMNENDKLKSELEKKNRDIYQVKHELAKLQELHQMPKYKDRSKSYVIAKIISRIPDQIKEEVLKSEVSEILMQRDYTKVAETLAEYRKSETQKKLELETDPIRRLRIMMEKPVVGKRRRRNK